MDKPGRHPWRDVAARCLNALFPEDCRVCHRSLETFSRIPVCRECLDTAKSFSPDFYCRRCRTPFTNRFPLDAEEVCRLCRGGGNRFDAAYTFGVYDGALRNLIRLLKYEGVHSLAGPLGQHLSEAFPRDAAFDAIVPAPMHWTRRLRRGYNHAELLAAELTRRTGVPMERALTRARRTAPQAQLTGALRRRNLRGAIRCSSGANIAGRRFLVVDDVFTTGATANACAAALKRAGASHVSILTAARADRRFTDLADYEGTTWQA